MFVYILALIIISIAFLMERYTININRYKSNFIIASVLFGILALRNIELVGIDMHTYSRFYEIMKFMSLRESLNFTQYNSILFYLYLWICAKLSLGLQLSFVILYLFIIIIIANYFYKYSENIYLSYLILLGTGIYTFMFSGIRQAVAMCFVLKSIENFDNEKIKSLIYWFILAVGFHVTAVVILPYFFICKLKANKIILMTYLDLIAIFVFFRIEMGTMITAFFDKVYNNLYIGFYQSEESIGGITILCLVLLMAYIFFFYYQIIKFKDEEATKILHALILMALIQICSAYAYSFTRLNFYYILAFMTIAFPKVFQKVRYKESLGTFGIIVNKLVLVAFIVVLINQYFIQIYGELLDNYQLLWSSR